MKKALTITFLSFIYFSFFSSCKKLQQNVLVNHKWKLNAYYLDTFSTNFMDNVVPLYKDCNGQCEYLITFKENGEMIAEYYTYDTLYFTRIGVWENLEFEKIYMKLDVYVDGEYYISNYDNKNYMLISNANTIFSLTKPVRLMVEKLK